MELHQNKLFKTCCVTFSRFKRSKNLKNEPNPLIMLLLTDIKYLNSLATESTDLKNRLNLCLKSKVSNLFQPMAKNSPGIFSKLGD